MVDILLGDINIPEEDRAEIDSDDDRHEGSIRNGEEQEQGGNEENNENQENEAEEGRVVEPKPKRVVKNPRPKLDPDRLCGSRGIAILEDVFENVRFRGPGYEKDDLDLMMKKLEHWAHRLFPLYQFDDFLQKVEKLGTKKQVQAIVKKIRLGMNTLHEEYQRDAEENQEEVQKVVEEDLFDAILRSGPTSNGTEVDVPPASPVQPPPRVVLTDEQRERMNRNRQLAIERREARLRARQLQLEAEELQNKAKGVSPLNTVVTQDVGFVPSIVESGDVPSVSNYSCVAVEANNKMSSENSDFGKVNSDMKDNDESNNPAVNADCTEEEMLELLSGNNNTA